MEGKQQSCSLEDTKVGYTYRALNIGNGGDAGVYNKPQLIAGGNWKFIR